MNGIPIIFVEENIKSAVYQPVSLFVDYLNYLLHNGVAEEQIPLPFFEIYALDYYDAQVRNGGHSQFIGNAGERLDKTMETALKGAKRLQVADLVSTLEQCRAWCDANPAERGRQNGFSERADVLERLDSQLYAATFDDAGHAAFVAAQTPAVQEWIKTATDASDFYARNKYHLAVAAWLLSHPDVAIVPGDQAKLLAEDVVKRHAVRKNSSSSSPSPSLFGRLKALFR